MNAVNFALADKVTVVTGASQGIGAACAERFAREDAPLALWDVDDLRGKALADRLKADGRRAIYLHCDVSRAEEVRAAVDATVAEYGRIDVLVNNAGIFRAADFLDVTEADWDTVLDVHLKGGFLVGQACARVMAVQGSGAIVNMSSVNGIMAIPAIASYNASKGGLNQLTRAMALALADRGVRVNAVAPGTIATELAAQAVLTSEPAKQRILSRTPMKRLGEPAEVADVVAFLASDAASYLTGQVVYCDGGRLALNYTVG